MPRCLTLENPPAPDGAPLRCGFVDDRGLRCESTDIVAAIPEMIWHIWTNRKNPVHPHYWFRPLCVEHEARFCADECVKEVCEAWHHAK